MSFNLSRRGFLKVGGGALLAGAVVALDKIGLMERYHRSQLPPVAAHTPNVLLIVLDTVRAQNLSLYGYQRTTTPNLEHMAESGVVFEQAISTSPWTLPSHATMLTGHWRHELSTSWYTPLDQTWPTLAEALRAHGYLTAAFVGNLSVCSYESGLNRGFTHYEDYLNGLDQAIESTSIYQQLNTNYRLRHLLNKFELPGRKSAKIVNEEFLNWLSHRGERPFFAFLNYYDAHNPYLPPKPFDQMFGPVVKRENPWLHPSFEWTREQVQAEMNAYDGAIAYIDQQIGVLLDQLNQQRLLDNTLVVIVSDHGEQFGDHNLMGHANSLYIQTLRVPLVMIFPQRIPVGQRVSYPVTLRDLPATVLNLLGLKNHTGFPGRSLARFWSDLSSPDQATNEMILSEVMFSPDLEIPEGPLEKGDMQSLVSGNYHYIRNGDGSEELYDILLDPAEHDDLLNKEIDRDVIQQFRIALKQILPEI